MHIRRRKCSKCKNELIILKGLSPWINMHLIRRGGHRTNKKIAINDIAGHVPSLRQQLTPGDLNQREKVGIKGSSGGRSTPGLIRYVVAALRSRYDINAPTNSENWFGRSRGITSCESSDSGKAGNAAPHLLSQTTTPLDVITGHGELSRPASTSPPLFIAQNYRNARRTPILFLISHYRTGGAKNGRCTLRQRRRRGYHLDYLY